MMHGQKNIKSVTSKT